MVLQFGYGQHFICKGKQMVCLVFGNVEIFVLHFLPVVKLTASEELQCHDDGRERCFHVVYHGV